MKALHMIGFILLVIGGLNWGLVGIGELFGIPHLNVVGDILGRIPWLEAIVYILVGVSAVVIAVTHKRDCKTCDTPSM